MSRLVGWGDRGLSRLVRPGVGLTLVVFLAALPELAITVPGVLPGPVWSAGSLQLLALCLLVGALALTYDLLFGMTGLLSFGHALYFALGVYFFVIALEQWHLAVAPAALLTVGVTLAVAVVVGAISLRVSGIAFAMVTLAFAQAGSILVYRNPGHLTGGEEGLGLTSGRIPQALVGVDNTQNLYWLALAILVIVYAAVWWAGSSRAGHVMAAVRENPTRAQVLGFRPYVVRLIAFVLAAVLAGVVGMGYVLVQGGASAQVSTSSFTLSLLVMVVLGGAGARWGAVLGGVLYTLLDQRLSVLAASQSIAKLPGILRVPLSQPMFLLGVLFVLVVLFLPGGIAGTVQRLTRRQTRISTQTATASTPDRNADDTAQVSTASAVSAR